MRKIITFVLLLFSVTCLTSGVNSVEPSKKTHQMRVLSTTSIIDDLVSKIGRERIKHQSLIVGELDPHSYELVKGDDEKLMRARIIFSNGLGLEHGASLRQHLQKHPHVVALGDEIKKNHPEMILSVNSQPDPHIWTDVSVWKEAVFPIAEALAKADPEGKEYYFKNARELQREMEQLHLEIFSMMQSSPKEKRFLVTSHDAFNYFTKAYLAEESEKENDGWKKRFAAPEGIAPEVQLSLLDIKEIVDYLCLHQIPVVFPESNVNQDSLKKIVSVCAEKGLKVKISKKPLYGDAMGSKNSGAEDYFSMMRHNARVLHEEWK